MISKAWSTRLQVGEPLRAEMKPSWKRRHEERTPAAQPGAHILGQWVHAWRHPRRTFSCKTHDVLGRSNRQAVDHFRFALEPAPYGFPVLHVFVAEPGLEGCFFVENHCPVEQPDHEHGDRN